MISRSGQGDLDTTAVAMNNQRIAPGKGREFSGKYRLPNGVYYGIEVDTAQPAP